MDLGGLQESGRIGNPVRVTARERAVREAGLISGAAQHKSRTPRQGVNPWTIVGWFLVVLLTMIIMSLVGTATFLLTVLIAAH